MGNPTRKLCWRGFPDCSVLRETGKIISYGHKINQASQSFPGKPHALVSPTCGSCCGKEKSASKNSKMRWPVLKEKRESPKLSPASFEPEKKAQSQKKEKQEDGNQDEQAKKKRPGSGKRQKTAFLNHPPDPGSPTKMKKFRLVQNLKAIKITRFKN